MIKLKIFYEDEDIIVVQKPAGVESQEARGFAQDMVSLIRNHRMLSTQLSTPPSTRRTPPYVGVIHRLDRQVSGVMVYAKTKKAAAVLSAAVQKGEVRKIYHAVVCGKPVDNHGQWVDYLLKNGKINTTSVVDKSVEDAKKAVLNYTVLGTAKVNERDLQPPAARNRPMQPGVQMAVESETKSMIDSASEPGVTAEASGRELSLLEIELLTGRHHQIRVQCASRDLPLWGDVKYNPAFQERHGVNPALCSVQLTFRHPVTGKQMTFSMKPEAEVFRLFPEEAQ